MNFAAIFITMLFGASKATIVNHTDGGGVPQDVNDGVPQDAVSNMSRPGLASASAAMSPNPSGQILSSAAPPKLRGAESFAADQPHPVEYNDQASVVNCKEGDAFDNSESPKYLGKTCFEECNNGKDCCGGAQACDRFTGKVAKDGSCMGDYACYGAGMYPGSIGIISGASCVGKQACFLLGYSAGSVGNLDSCCTEDLQCQYDINSSDLPEDCSSGKGTTSKEAQVTRLISENMIG